MGESLVRQATALQRVPIALRELAASSKTAKSVPQMHQPPSFEIHGIQKRKDAAQTSCTAATAPFVRIIGIHLLFAKLENQGDRPGAPA